MSRRKRANRSTPTEEIPPIPFGILDLESGIQFDAGPPEKIRCPVIDCPMLLTPPARKKRGEICDEHRIRIHKSGTYSYPDPRYNAIVGRDILPGVIAHPFKFESHRLGAERSEDMLSWNVFRSFQEAGQLHLIGNLITGLSIQQEPQLYLWGLQLTGDIIEPWDLLITARKHFEKKLPVKRPLTEPDIGLFLDGQYLILIEAKFCSPNTCYEKGPRRDQQSLTLTELLNIYWTLTAEMLDREKALEADKVYYQLWRNVIFAEHMASLAKKGTQPYFANLTRRHHENDSFNHFLDLVKPEHRHQVSHIFWEDLFTLAGVTGGKLDLLREYLLTKTANLLPAFDFGLW